MTRESHLFASPHPAFADRRQFLSAPARASACSRWPPCSTGRACSRGRASRPPGRSALNPLAPQPAHFPGKAKSVIWLFMNGGPSQVDTWDYKPELEKRDGQELEGLRQEHRLLHRPGRPADEVAVQVRAARPVRARGSREIFPNMAKHVDDMAFIHSLLHRHRTTTRRPCSRSTPGMTRMGFPCVGVVGHLRPGQREPEPARRSSSCTTRSAAGCPRGTRRTGARASCRASSRGRALKPQGAPIDNLDRARRA